MGFCVARTKNGLVSDVPCLADRHLPFLHRFQQGRLRFRRRAVDFVGQDDVVKQRPLDEAELAFAGLAILLQHVGPGDVGGHQVGGELDAARRSSTAHRASVLIISVLASPGTPSSRQCPRLKSAISSWSMTSVLPDDDAGHLLRDLLVGPMQSLNRLLTHRVVRRHALAPESSG